MPNEIELKLRIAPADIGRLRRHAAIKQHLAGQPVTRRLVSIYYDTPELKLLDAAISLRVRRMSGGWFQAVKSAGHSLAGLHQRMEWEDIIAKGEPDFSKITEPGLAALFADRQLREALRPLFTTDVQRTEWQLEYEDGSSIEVALDLGELRCNGQDTRPAERIEELEIELKHGKASHVFELALALQADIPLHIENVSKAQRGYAFYQMPQMFAAEASVALAADANVREAFHLLAGQCLQQIQHNQEVLLSGERTAVAALCLAWQQLAFALKLFKLKCKHLSPELNWIAAALSAVCDWQTFIARILPAAAHELTLPAGQDVLQQRAHVAYDRAWNKLLQALHSQRYQRLLLNLGRKMVDDGLPTEKKAWPRLRRTFQHRYNKFKKQEPDLHHLRFKAVHKLRTKACQLLHSAELLSGIAAPDGHHQYCKQLADVEQSLRVLQHALLAEILAKRLLRGRVDDSARQALDALRQWNKERMAEAAIHAHASWQALAGT